jgi:hypothetical protein
MVLHNFGESVLLDEGKNLGGEGTEVEVFVYPHDYPGSRSDAEAGAV